MLTRAEVEAARQAVLTETAEAAARTSGGVRRVRRWTGATLVHTLVLGWLAAPAASLEQLCPTAARLGVTVTPQALEQRLTAALAHCLQTVLEASLRQVVLAAPVAVPLLAPFTGVYLLDSTTIALPDALATEWSGGGGRTARARPQR